MGKDLFVVVVFQSFDPNTPTYLFDDEDKANEFAKELWIDAYVTEVKESAHGVDLERSYWDDEENEGEIYWNWDDQDYIRFFITQVTDKRN